MARELLADLALDVAPKAATGFALVDFGEHWSGPAWLVIFCVHRLISPALCSDLWRCLAPSHSAKSNAWDRKVFQPAGNFFCPRALAA